MIAALALCATLMSPPISAGHAAAACSCAGPRTDAEAVRGSDAAFEGRVVGRRVIRRQGWNRVVYTFAVTRWRKGTPSRRVEVETGLGGGDCGVVIDRRHVVTVYAHADSAARLHTGICSGPYLPDPAPPPPSERGR